MDSWSVACFGTRAKLEETMSVKAVQSVDDDTAWKSTDFVHPREWTHRFTPTMLGEIERATRAVMARDIPFWKITRQDFPLPETSEMLAKAYDDLENGRGFTVLAGFPVDDYSYDERLFAYSRSDEHTSELQSLMRT